METPIPVLQRCDSQWSERSQMIAMAEESAELSASVSRFLNGKCELSEVMTEAADVSIMLDQFSRRWGADFAAAKDRKVQKLVARLDALDAAARGSHG